MKPYDWLFFDLDGTLTDSGLGIMRCAAHALRHFGIEVSDLNVLRPFIGPPLEDSFQQFYRFSPEQAEQAASDTQTAQSGTGKLQVITIGPVSQGDADAVFGVCQSRGLTDAGLYKSEWA